MLITVGACFDVSHRNVIVANKHTYTYIHTYIHTYMLFKTVALVDDMVDTLKFSRLGSRASPTGEPQSSLFNNICQ